MTVLTDFQFEINGLLIGPSTHYLLRGFDGIRDTPEVRQSDQVKAQQHGMWAGRDLLGRRTITLDMIIQGSSHATLEALIDAVITKTNVGDEFIVSYKLPGQVQRRFSARCRNRDIPGAYQRQASRISDCSFRLDCTDPRLYADTLESGVTSRAVASGGMTFNATFNLTFGTGGTGGNIIFTNDGNFPAPWIATLTGDLVNPRINYVTTNKSLIFNLSLAVGDVLVIDSLKKTVILNGTASRYNTLTTAQWFELAVGLNEVKLLADSGSGTMTFAFRDTWV